MKDRYIRRETRHERRDRKLRNKYARMPKHAKTLARVYMDAVLKRLKRKRVE